jgi:hypothetical protein
MDPSRRSLIGAAGAGGLAVATAPASAARRPAVHDDVDAAWLQAILERYAGFGDKASGGPGDEACRIWLQDRLTHDGYVCARQDFQAPFFTARKATLSVGETHADIIPQARIVQTGAQGLTAPLRPAGGREDLTGAIALLVLPYKRWASLADPQVARPLTDAFSRGAVAAVVVTTGPSGEAIALNVTTHKPGFSRPVAILAPKDAAPFLAAAAAGRPATLVVDGVGGDRPASNLIARLDRKAAKTLVVSTPRSGWFGCAAERGSGLAVWLALAHWLARAKVGVNVELLATSGHEYDYLGGEHYLAEAAPKPQQTKLWVHIGASAAARDWHEIGPTLRPLPSADPQRVLTATPDVIDRVRPAFRGVSGLEAVYVADKVMAGGELINVLDAGYPSAMGLYGAHRYFHTRADDLRCISGDLVLPVATAFRRAVTASLLG